MAVNSILLNHFVYSKGVPRAREDKTNGNRELDNTKKEIAELKKEVAELKRQILLLTTKSKRMAYDINTK